MKRSGISLSQGGSTLKLYSGWQDRNILFLFHTNKSGRGLQNLQFDMYSSKSEKDK